MYKNSTPPLISVVVIALNEGSHLRRTVSQLQATLPEPSEIVVADDGSDDGCADFLAAANGCTRLVRANHLGIAKARNFGAARARGEFLVFADAHVATPPGWWGPLLELLRNPSVGGVSPAIADMEAPENVGFGQRFRGPDLSVSWLPQRAERPYQVPLLPGGFLAMRRNTFEAVGGFDPGMIGWGSEDAEVSLRLWRLGYEAWVVPQVEVAHLFRDELHYDVEWSWILHNKLRLAAVHLSSRRIAAAAKALRKREGFAEALALMIGRDVSTRRAQLAAHRSHDDSWFFRSTVLEGISMKTMRPKGTERPLKKKRPKGTARPKRAPRPKGTERPKKKS